MRALAIILLVFFAALAVWYLFLRRRVRCTTTPPPDRNAYYYKAEELPLKVFYDFSTNRKNTFGAEYEAVQAAVDDFNLKLNYAVFELLPMGAPRPEKLDEVIHIKDSLEDGECSKPFPGLSGVVANATFPPDKQVCLDSQNTWNPHSLKNVVIHELGHSLGLEHDNDKEHVSIMNAGYSSQIDGLQLVDITAILQKYPFMRK